MSIIVALGGAVTGIVFRRDIEKGDDSAKRIYLVALALFAIALVYPWGSYLALTVKNFDFALRYSFGGYLIALLAFVTVYIVIQRKWNLDKEGKMDYERVTQESEETEQEKLKREFQYRRL
jgi:amino acid permease